MKKLLFYSLMLSHAALVFSMDQGNPAQLNETTLSLQSTIENIINPLGFPETVFKKECNSIKNTLNTIDSVNSGYLLYNVHSTWMIHPRIRDILTVLVLNSRPCHFPSHPQDFLDEHELSLEQLNELEKSEGNSSTIGFSPLKKKAKKATIAQIATLLNKKAPLFSMETSAWQAEKDQAITEKMSGAIIFPESQEPLIKELSGYSLNKLNDVYKTIMRRNKNADEKANISSFFSRLKNKILADMKTNLTMLERFKIAVNQDELSMLYARIDEITDDLLTQAKK